LGLAKGSRLVTKILQGGESFIGQITNFGSATSTERSIGGLSDLGIRSDHEAGTAGPTTTATATATTKQEPS
jgi:hypothetical protein